MGRLDLSADCRDGAFSGAGRAALTLICINDKTGKLFYTYARGAALFIDMSLIFVAEVTKGGKDGVGSGLTQSAKSGGLYGLGKLLKLFDVAVLAFSGGNSRISSILLVPIRQGVHLPQDSSTVKSRKNLAMSTMQLSSSITIRPPEPIMEPMAIRCRSRHGVSIRMRECIRLKDRPSGPP